MGKHRRPTAGAQPSRLGNVLAKLRLDLYVLAQLGTVGVASILPARGSSAVVLTHATTIAIGF
ncbi:MAG: hypothetical protein QOD82_1373, partial [Pseudonocardiales bacterium]|nr:hypothetical protein [Pseudonocardiales bacterium]